MTTTDIILLIHAIAAAASAIAEIVGVWREGRRVWQEPGTYGHSRGRGRAAASDGKPTFALLAMQRR